MPVKLVVYDLEEGVEFLRDSVTAHECVENGRGRYSLKKPKGDWPPTKSASAVEQRESSPPPASAAPAGAGNRRGRPAKPAPAPATHERTDPFAGIKGIGPSIALRLTGAGFPTIEHLANSTPQEVAAAVKLPGKSARVIAEERWIEQAQELATRPEGASSPAAEGAPAPAQP